MPRLTKETILEFLRTHKDHFRSEFGVNKIGLFGSYVRDEQKAGSDIDLVIWMDKSNFDKRMDLKYFVQDHFNVPVDVGYFDNLRSFVREAVEDEIVYA